MRYLQFGSRYTCPQKLKRQVFVNLEISNENSRNLKIESKNIRIRPNFPLNGYLNTTEILDTLVFSETKIEVAKSVVEQKQTCPPSRTSCSHLRTMTRCFKNSLRWDLSKRYTWKPAISFLWSSCSSENIYKLMNGKLIIFVTLRTYCLKL